jgi:hypothetical protein
MVETVGSLVTLSDATAQLVERTAGSIASVRGGGRWHSSGIHRRPGIIVTAEEVLERDENIELTLAGCSPTIKRPVFWRRRTLP